MGVVRLIGRYNSPSRRQLAGYPERLQISQRSAGSQVAEEGRLLPAKHRRYVGYGFNLHLRAGPAAVARVVVGIDGHGQRIGRPRHRMRRLEHLPGIEGMEIGIVVAQPVCGGLKHSGNRSGIDTVFTRRLKFRQCRKLRLKQFRGAGKQSWHWIV